MTDTALPLSTSPRQFDFKRLLALFIRPRQAITALAAEEKPAWLLPMLVVSVLFLVRIIVSGHFQALAASMGQLNLPTDFQYWPPEMQNAWMQSQQTMQGPVYVYIMPAILGLVKLWLAWFIVAGLTHLASTLFGGRGKMTSALNLVAWACLPFAIRDILRVIYMLSVHHTIANPGFSGLVAIPFLTKLLTSVDIFFVWFAVLLVAGIHKADTLPLGKAIASVAIVLVVVLLAQAGVGVLALRLSNMTITRMF